ncbi:MAG: hypothetical protein M1828_005100 [Chrysothrix sp. TS-e1954]|nr:MAG: hypothetical protein M1828_005100 [Chrysothrix sp. TS-e1954]
MSLYNEAAALLDKYEKGSGSLKSHIYGSKDLKSKPGHVYALCSESIKWSDVLSHVIEKTGALSAERKVDLKKQLSLTPALALLLVHDLLLSKDGVAAPKAHPLRLAVEKHKMRLQGEFTRARVKAGQPNVQAWRAQLDRLDDQDGQLRPRWVRINTFLTKLEEQCRNGALKSFTTAPDLEAVVRAPKAEAPYFVTDATIPCLVACSPHADFSQSSPYKSGHIILQDKASCFPAYLLNPTVSDGDIIDACAAPGNKTTHLAALLREAQTVETASAASGRGQTISAIERDRERGATLQKMVRLAGAEQDGLVSCIVGQDFLRVDPRDPKWSKVGAILLDPSCSGSGIIGRDDAESSEATPQKLTLPRTPAELAMATDEHGENGRTNKKRKRNGDVQSKTSADLPRPTRRAESKPEPEHRPLAERLEALSNFQVAALEHAFQFPAARKVVYSTCSVHAEENEQVVPRALRSSVARRRRWRVLKRDEQVSGMKNWHLRGSLDALSKSAATNVSKKNPSDTDTDDVALSRDDLRVMADACLRCEKGTKDGTMGFFAVGFVRDGSTGADCDAGLSEGASSARERVEESVEAEEEWEGFDDVSGMAE